MSWILDKLFGLDPGKLARADRITPSLNADYTNWAILGMSAALILLVAVTIRSYLRERGAGRGARGVLAGVRILVILVIFALLCQPGVTLRFRKDVHATVVVLMDDSLSMSLKDRYADAGARAALAARLGVGEDALGEMSRRDVVKAILGAAGGPLAEFTRDRKLMLMRFAAAEGDYTRKMGEVPPEAEAPPDTDADAEVNALTDQLVSRGRQTSLARALADAADKTAGRRVAGIVLVSDGQDTGDWGATSSADPLRSVLAKLQKRGIPVYAVAVGDPEPRRNVTVTRLQAPRTVRKGAEVELTAYVSSRGGAAETTLKLLRRPAGTDVWNDIGVSKAVTLAGSGGEDRPAEREVPLRDRAGDLGEFEYKVCAAAVEAEADLADNEATARVHVTDEKLKILMISADGGWEFQFLRNLLLRQGDRYAVSVWQQNADKQFNQEASSGMRLTRLPRDRKDLFQYEVVILYDPAYTKDGFDGEFAKTLEEFVGNRHGGLCYIASNKYSEDNLIGNVVFQPLADMLPVVLDRRQIDIADRIAEPDPVAWPVLPTAIGLEHPVMRFSGDASVNMQVWESLPGLYWSHPVFKLKPLGSALAVSSDPRSRLTGAPDAGANPVIAVQYYGKGRVLYIGSDETWRWRYINDGQVHREFWSNVVDFLASGRLQRQRVIITTGPDRFTVGETLRVKVEAYDRDYSPLKDAKFAVDMIGADGGTVEKIELHPAHKDKPDGRYEGEVTLKELGTFQLTAKRDDPSFENMVFGKTVTVVLPEEERRNPEADPARLQTIAKGDRFLWIQQADELPRRVPVGRLTLFEFEPEDLWDTPAVIVLVVGLLAVEWILRKKHNMT